MRAAGIIVVILSGMAMCACTPESSDVTGSTNACPARQGSYNPKDINQCVNACLSCDKGTMVTCSMSCNLKGAK